MRLFLNGKFGPIIVEEDNVLIDLLSIFFLFFFAFIPLKRLNKSAALRSDKIK
ncbi:hypothetical protein PRUB_a2016 [Pseudoalteromonas rubra]|uniref:Uncharacterized protein n=1 Tax=Pseudoalteromonas rubra TaxID=43658 RepID=A0A8T0CDP7_9GAMM|nr:hypothetical protein PRUB_a2016 [Pseudoalteromonas rubra]